MRRGSLKLRRSGDRVEPATPGFRLFARPSSSGDDEAASEQGPIRTVRETLFHLLRLEELEQQLVENVELTGFECGEHLALDALAVAV